MLTNCFSNGQHDFQRTSAVSWCATIVFVPRMAKGRARIYRTGKELPAVKMKQILNEQLNFYPTKWDLLGLFILNLKETSRKKQLLIRSVSLFQNFLGDTSINNYKSTLPASSTFNSKQRGTVSLYSSSLTPGISAQRKGSTFMDG